MFRESQDNSIGQTPIIAARHPQTGLALDSPAGFAPVVDPLHLAWRVP
jgi:hypothetical protein